MWQHCSSQIGFRNIHCTILALSEFVVSVVFSFDKGTAVYAVLKHLSNAFDKVYYKLEKIKMVFNNLLLAYLLLYYNRFHRWF